MAVIPLTSTERLARVAYYAHATLLLTSVHHAYGAYIYATPWRLHVVGFAVIAAAVIGIATAAWRRLEAGTARTIAGWTVCATALAFPFTMIGFFEGGYNHVAKDLLYFAGASTDLMRRWFPPPTYEMPDDVVFELTGVAQLVLAAIGTRHVYVLARSRVDRAPGTSPLSAASASTPRHRG